LLRTTVLNHVLNIKKIKCTISVPHGITKIMTDVKEVPQTLQSVIGQTNIVPALTLIIG